MSEEIINRGLLFFKKLCPEVDLQKGISNCAGSESFYIELLKDYAASDNKSLLCKYFEDENWLDYGIKVHALKSNSRSLGLPVLGDIAEKLQDAAEQNDVSFIRENHPLMVKKLTKIVESIQICFP